MHMLEWCLPSCQVRCALCPVSEDTVSRLVSAARDTFPRASAYANIACVARVCVRVICHTFAGAPLRNTAHHPAIGGRALLGLCTAGEVASRGHHRGAHRACPECGIRSCAVSPQTIAWLIFRSVAPHLEAAGRRPWGIVPVGIEA